MDDNATVLIAYMPTPRDLAIVARDGWYRIPYNKLPRRWWADYIAFYCGGSFGAEGYTIQHFAPIRGHELRRRIDLLPAESGHKRALEWYLMLQLGPLQSRNRPIVNLRWRRLLFAITTGRHFMQANEVGDLWFDTI